MYTRETSGIEGNSIHVYVNKIALQGFRFCYGFPGPKSFGDQVRALARDMSLCSWAHALYSHSAFFPQGI